MQVKKKSLRLQLLPQVAKLALCDCFAADEADYAFTLLLALGRGRLCARNQSLEPNCERRVACTWREFEALRDRLDRLVGLVGRVGSFRWIDI